MSMLFPTNSYADLRDLHPPQQGHYSVPDASKQLAPMKPERKFLHLILESSSMTPQYWNNVSYNLYDILPQPKMNELLMADYYHFQLESISWEDKAYTDAYTISIDNIINDSVFSNKPSLKNTLETTINDDYIAYQHEGSRGIKTTDKSWLQQGKLNVSFKDIKGVALGSNAFQNAATITTRYTANILLSYL